MVIERDEERASLVPSDAKVSWGSVEEKADRVLIVATGPSVSRLPTDQFVRAAEAGVYILGVNLAALWLPAIHGWITVDVSHINRTLMKEKRKGTTYYAAVPEDYGSPTARVSYHRVVPVEEVVYLRRVQTDGPLGLCMTLSESPDRIHTGNSAWGALGLSYLMKAKRIAMLGVDGNQKGYAYIRRLRPHTNFNHLPKLFASALPQLLAAGVKVVNGSPASLVSCFKRMKPQEAVDWLVSE